MGVAHHHGACAAGSRMGATLVTAVAREYKLARALVEAHVDPVVAGVVLDALDAWHEAVVDAEAALARIAHLDTDAHLSVRQLAEWWGVSTDAIYQLVQKGDLPDRRVGGQIRVPVSAARAYLDEHTTTHEPPAPKPRASRTPPADAETVKQYPWLKGA